MKEQGVRESAADFPFYNGEPVELSGKQWVALLLLCLSGFLLLTLFGWLFTGPLTQMIPALCFAGLPLLGLACAGPRCLPALFRPLTAKALLLIPAFALLNLLITVIVALLVASNAEVSVNPAVALIRSFNNFEFLVFLVRTLPQLVGEELITILPFLALLTYFVRVRGWSKKMAVVTAWLLTAILFGALHLPTYEWNVAQSLFIIGSARLVLTAAYLVTGNLWVSAGAHIFFDWMIFLVAFLVPEVEV